MVPVHDYEKRYAEALAITKIRTFKHEPLLIVGGGGGGASSWYVTVYVLKRVNNVSLTKPIASVLVGSTNADINDCSAVNRNCSQICTNITGSYVCSCHSGYLLGEDNQTCNGKSRLNPY